MRLKLKVNNQGREKWLYASVRFNGIHCRSATVVTEVYVRNLSPGPEDKLLMGYKSIMQTDE